MFLQIFSLLLSFSSAILKYLVRKYQLPDHWYPSDLQRQAKVDEYLGWHGGNLRRGAASLLFLKVHITNSQFLLSKLHNLQYVYCYVLIKCQHHPLC